MALAVGIIPCMILRIVLLGNYEERSVAEKSAQIQNQCTILGNQLISSGYLEGKTSEVVDAELTQLSNIYSGRVMIVDGQFEIIKDTYDMDEGKILASQSIIECFKGKGTSHYDGKNQYIEVTVPVMDQEAKNVLGVILASVSTDSIADSLEVYREKANIMLMTIVLILLIVVAFCSGKMMRPFHRLSDAIDAVTEGYDSGKIEENQYSETEKISESVNKMLVRWKKVDDSRQEFVSNVSHELKTPLTSMKVLEDSLLAQGDVPAELYKEFMEDITEEIEREDKIINDLLSLVKMDKTSANTMNVTSENINELVEKCLKRLQPIAAKANIELVLESFRPVSAEVDEMKFSQAVTNLVENAIKYNKENGFVHVSLNADHKYFYLKVEDSGIGIPEDAIDHIFERFYRVDKSHSREIGGTGLGLAIARGAVIMHRGAIKVYSEPGEGTTFTVRIPLTYVA